MNLANNIAITKVTHAGRPLAAQTARAHGATVTDTKALGGWQETGSFRACYDRALPMGALLGVAHFDANRPEAYLLARDYLGGSRAKKLLLHGLTFAQILLQIYYLFYSLGSKQKPLLLTFDTTRTSRPKIQRSNSSAKSSYSFAGSWSRMRRFFTIKILTPRSSHLPHSTHLLSGFLPPQLHRRSLKSKRMLGLL